MKSNRDKLAKTKSEINDRLTEIGKMRPSLVTKRFAKSMRL